VSNNFNDELYDAAATRGQVGGVALDVALGLQSVAAALTKLNATSSADISPEIAEIQRAREQVWNRFVMLTGYNR
jgi:hypothetical protein